MHLPHPRIPPLTDSQLTPEQREALAPASTPGRPPLNIFRTLAHAPDALRLPFSLAEKGSGDEGRKHERAV